MRINTDSIHLLLNTFVFLSYDTQLESLCPKDRDAKTKQMKN